MTTIKHILVDIVDIDSEYKTRIIKQLSTSCLEILEKENGVNKLEVYKCGVGYVYLYSIGNNVLLDIVNEEAVFDRLVKELPKDNLVIRLVERGFPED